MPAKTWLEVALNGPWSRALQPRIPITVTEIVAEGVACVRAGAAIVHVHAYDEATGRQHDDPDVYAAIIEGIRGQVDAIVYPTIPFAGSLEAASATTPAARYAAVEALARRGLLEWCVVDPGTVNISNYQEIAAGRVGLVYLNSEADIRHGLELAARYRFHPSYAIYEPGFTRLGAALAGAIAETPAPIYRFMFSSGFTFGFPPASFALDAHLKLLEQVAPAETPWMIAGLAVDILPLAWTALRRGGHLRVGLEDAPLRSTRSNVEWAEAGVEAIRAAWREPASAAEVRAALSQLASPAVQRS
jgi:3-keto-5-aminohexanoate cleavage enzyme